ncbi:membrane protein [Candidatus Phycorickettsia trachydisci]|uniref:Membrane protein n=1 Tax=Candidatus Phycorickettsia trachydisci TaxID=2115978 RepID=A0A2P1P944_9RICK|nr:M23 family metallopeptidase [Candidatus Phycorickettsia trachydisci]AVP87775.1 membrane protein [Candidatus Phycorickettsia trachydisci]
MYFNELKRNFDYYKALAKLFFITCLSCAVFMSVSIILNDKSSSLNLSDQTTTEENLDDDIEQQPDQTAHLDIVVNQDMLLSALLKSKSINPKEVTILEQELKKRKIPQKVYKGDKLKITLKNTDQEDMFNIWQLGLYSFKNSLQLDAFKKDDNFIIQNQSIELMKSFVKISSPINSSLFDTLKKLNIPLNSINELIKSYSHQIDFQRQVKANDKIELIVEKYAEVEGNLFYYGHIAFSKLSLGKNTYPLYRYSWGNNQTEYFSKDGHTYKKNLLKNPIQATRISSHFGSRKHPILGYTRMHKGVDFAAPRGTPIYAAGDGVITGMGRKGGYGNFVQIKHHSSLSTFYAHISKFHPSIKPGTRIKQGKVIAYVGATGTASGPHLHYEVHINGRAVNPLSIKTSTANLLSPLEVKKFRKYRDYLHEVSKVLDTKDTYVLGKTASSSNG